jgi:hypothetical protein
LSQVQALLGPDVVLVGQSVKSDVAWMQLEEVWILDRPGVDAAFSLERGEGEGG